VSIPGGLRPPQAFKARCRAGGASSILAKRAADSNRNACTPIRFRGGARALAGSLSIMDPPPGANRWEIAEDGEIESHGFPIRHPVSGRGQPPGWFILHEEGGLLESHGVTRASASNGARPLAGSPSMSTVPGIRTPITRDLKAVSLPLD
jgi:hypothetical protein